MPTVYNGIGTWYYGKRRIHRLKGVCNFCHAVGELQSYDTTLYFVVFFVPILPLSRKRVLEACPYCNRHRVVSLKKWEQSKSEDIARLLEKLEQNPDDRDTIQVALSLAIAYQDAALFEKLANSLAAHRLEDPALQAQLGGAYAYFAKQPEAEAAYRASLAVEDNSVVRRQLALVLLKQGRPDDAVPYIRDILENKIKEESWLVYYLIEAYQAQGMHQQALDLMNLRDAAFPELVADKGVQKQRKTSLRYLNSGKKIKSAYLTESGKAGYQEGNWTSYIPRLIPPVIIVALLCWYLGAALYIGQSRTVYLVNGWERPYTVLVNGQPYSLMQSSATAIRVPEGEIRIERADPSVPLEAEECRVGTPFYSRPFLNRTFVINPDQLAVLGLERIEYSQNPRRGPQPEFVLGKLLQSYDGVDYPFTTPPATIKVKQGQTVTKVHLAVVPGMTASQRRQAARQMLDQKERLAFEKRLVLWNPKEDLLLRSLLDELPAEEAIELLKVRLGDRPLLVEWHRSYQDVMEKAKRTEQLRAYYDGLAAEIKQDPNVLYLQARLEDEDLDKAEQMLKQAASARPPSAYAMNALGYHAMARGDFAEAYRWSSEVIAAAPQIESLRLAHRAVLLGAGKYDELLKLLEQEKVKSAEQFPLLMQEIVAYAALGNIVKAQGVIDEVMKSLEQAGDGPTRQAMQSGMQSLVCCARGDEAGFLKVADRFPELNPFAAAFLRGKFEEATQVDKKDRTSLPQHGLLFLAAAKSGNRKFADEQFQIILKELENGPRHTRQIGQMLAGQKPLNVDTVLRQPIDVKEKPVLLAVVAQRYPDSAGKLIPLAKKLNFAPEPTALCLRKMLGQTRPVERK
jgi:tetratricopeptide (TPR) repeat protein